MKSKIVAPIGIAVGVLAFAGFALGPVIGAVPVDTSELRSAVTLDGVRSHQAELQAIADANGGVRLAGALGHDESANYVAATAAAAGYNVTTQPFDFIKFEPLGPSTLEQITPVSSPMSKTPISMSCRNPRRATLPVS